MKHKYLSLCLLTATLFAVLAYAQSDAPKTPPPPPPGQDPLPRREEMIKHFDQDGDGKLSDTERQAAREAMQEKWGRQGGPGGPPGFRGPGGAGGPPPWMRHELHRWFEMKWSGQGGPGHHPRHGKFDGPRGKLRAEFLKRFDHDGDGRLGDTERAEARKAGEAMRARKQARHQEILARFDQDGDGKLGETERQAAEAAWQKFLGQHPVLPAKPAAK